MPSTVQDLEALPVGRTIQVRGRRTFTWTRTEAGWQSESGGLLSSDYFAGHLAAGEVTDPITEGPVAGSWWSYGDSVFFLYDLNGTGTRVKALQYLLSEPDDAAVEVTPMRRHFGAAYQRATPDVVAQVCTQSRFTDALMGMYGAVAERDQRTQEVRVLKNRPDPTVIQPLMDEVASSVAVIQRAIQRMNDTLRNGQTEF